MEFSSLRHSHKFSRCWLVGACPCSHQRLSGQAGLFIYSAKKGSLPPIFGAQCATPSFPRVFIALIAYYSVSLFFPQVEVGLSRGLFCSGPGLSVGVLHTTKLTWSTSSQAIWAPATGGLGPLLVSLFNVKWRFSVPAGGCGGVKVMPLLSDYACKVCLQRLSKISL
jgi:hypothetical protein